MYHLFLVMLNLRSKFFSEFYGLQSALDSEFIRGCVQAPSFLGHAKFEVKFFRNFLITEHSGLCISQR